jgi:hypothetical protein
LAIVAALAACSSRTPTERERAVAGLPSEAQLVAAADGTALGPLRAVVDAARAFLPATLDCVVDAALTSEAVAVAVTPRVGATIVVITRAHVARCPALSRIANDTFVATLGAGTVAARPAASPLHDPRWARARSYLTDDPVALAIAGDDVRVVAVAQPRPLAGWLAIDAGDGAAVDRDVRAWIARQRTSGLQAFASRLTVQTRGSQVLVQAAKLESSELALITTDLLRVLDAPARSSPPTIACPANSAEIVRCTDGTHVVVRSLATSLRKLVTVKTEPVVAGGDLVGIRLTEDPELLLRRGDILLGLDGHRIASAAHLAELARYVQERTTLAVRRDGTDLRFELSE